MKIFISWSGSTSKQVAEAFRDWLPNVIQKLQPWMSDVDIDKGSNWLEEIFGQLADTKFGLVCVTTDNQKAPWLLFEAGALSKEVKEKAFVCPFLFDLSKADLKGPLTHFQATGRAKEDLKKLILTINKSITPDILPTEKLNVAFEKWWPELESRLDNIQPEIRAPRVERTQKEILEEILELVRALARREDRMSYFPLTNTLADGIGPMKDEMRHQLRNTLLGGSEKDPE